MKPVMVVLAGPNGAGKSTLYATRVAPAFAGPFINADLIQRDELRDSSMQAAYDAARVADERRAECLAHRRDFVTGTVFSHPAKLDLIREAQARGAVLLADRGMVFDNSALNRPPVQCPLFSWGRLATALPRLPQWVRQVYAAELVI